MQSRKNLWAAVCVVTLPIAPAAFAAPPPGIQAELTNTFRSYMRDLRERPRSEALSTCAPDRHCIAEYFSKRYLASFAQRISDGVADGQSPVVRADPLDLELGVAKVHEYNAATTAPLRAVLTIAASDAKGDCLPLIRIQYYQESQNSLLWRIDGVEHDSSQVRCDASRVMDEF